MLRDISNWQMQGAANEVYAIEQQQFFMLYESQLP